MDHDNDRQTDSNDTEFLPSGRLSAIICICVSRAAVDIVVQKTYEQKKKKNDPKKLIRCFYINLNYVLHHCSLLTEWNGENGRR